MIESPIDADVVECITPACARRRRGARRAVHGLRVCAYCCDEFRDALTEIPDRWLDLDDPVLIFPQKGEAVRRSPGQAPGAPINLTWSALQDPRTVWIEPGDLIHPVDALGGYRTLLLDALAGRAVTVTDGRRPFYRSGGTVSDVCRAIAAHDNFAMRQDWAGYLCWAVRLVRDQLRSLTGAPRTRPVGYCPEAFGDGTWCGYPLWYPDTGDLECGGCGGVWPRRQWLRLADEMEAR